MLAEHGIRPSKALGQHFVADPNTIRRIVRLAGVQRGDKVVEIGAGLGSLTTALAECGAQVVAVEIDHRLAAVLREQVAPWPVTVVEADALRLNWDELLGPQDHSRNWKLVGNLPYNVATPLVLHVLEHVPQVESLFIMVQREVAERLVAIPGDASYGAVSVKVAYWSHATLAGRVPATVFIPQPRVESELVRIGPRRADADRSFYPRFESIVRAGFAQRRKMLRRSLARAVAPEAFAFAGVSPEARAEELGLEAWSRLAAYGTGKVP